MGNVLIKGGHIVAAVDDYVADILGTIARLRRSLARSQQTMPLSTTLTGCWSFPAILMSMSIWKPPWATISTRAIPLSRAQNRRPLAAQQRSSTLPSNFREIVLKWRRSSPCGSRASMLYQLWLSRHLDGCQQSVAVRATRFN